MDTLLVAYGIPAVGLDVDGKRALFRQFIGLLE
jgi:hypothetical protein